MSYSPNTPVVSTLNSTSATLAASPGPGHTFTGTAELAPRGELLVQSKSDVAGTLYFDFSTDGTNWDSTFPSTGYTCAAGVPEVHRAVVGGRYFRVRYVNGGTGQGYFRLQTSFATTGPLSAPIGFNIADDADAIVTKSVISGVGNTTATVTDHKALQVTPPPEAKTAFGEALTGQLTPIIQLAFPYNLNPTLVTMRNNQSGSAAVSNSMAQLSTGAATASSSTMISTKFVKYSPGLGVRLRFTAMFTTGVADNTQIAGIGDSGEGFFFGYNGTSFGVMRRYGGSPEVRLLTVSAGANDGTGTDNVTITLDGDAKTVELTDFSGTATITANEIAAADYSDVGRGWTAKAIGNTVRFISWDSAVHNGTFSFADTDSTGAAASFSQEVVGAAPTEVWVAQSSWNGEDKFDGTGITGVTLDPTKGNVYQIDFQYLGFGAIRFYVEDPDDGELHLVHTFAYANTYTRPSLDDPSMPFYAATENGSTNSSNVTLSIGSVGGFIDGMKLNNGFRRATKNTLTLSGSSTETPILSIRMSEVFQSKINRSLLKINYITCSVEHTKPCALNFYANPTLVGASWTSLDGSAGTTTVFRDISATSFSGGTLLFTIFLGKTGNATVDFKDDILAAEFGPGTILTATLAPTSTNGAEGNVSVNFTENL